MTPPAQGPTTLSPARSRLALLALALGGFGIGTSEFVAMGLLPNIARDMLPGLYISNPAEANAHAAWLITAYALGVVVGAPTIAAFSARFPRKALLVVLAIAFTFFTILTASLPTFPLVLIARFLTALPHGAYFGVAALVAAELMGDAKRGRGVAFVIGGLTVANIVGVPFGTWVGQVAGWRMGFYVVAVIFALTALAIWLTVPHQAGDRNATMRNELRAFARPQVWFALAFGSIGFGGLFAAYTYVNPMAVNVAGIDESFVPVILVLFGVGMTVGNFFGGWFADRGIPRAVLMFFGAMIIALTGLAIFAPFPFGFVLFMVLIGAASSAMSPAIQVRLIDVAGDSKTLAASVNHAALNLGNALGAFLGGIVIAAGFGYLAPVYVGIALTVIGLVIAAVSFAISRRTDRTMAVPTNTASTVTVS